MEININKDIREYTEGVFFGLNLRQLICSGLAVASAVAVYLSTRETFSKDVITYFCIAAAIPFAVAFMKDNFIVPRRLTVKANNTYLEALRGYFATKEKEAINAKEHTVTNEAG